MINVLKWKFVRSQGPNASFLHGPSDTQRPLVVCNLIMQSLAKRTVIPYYRGTKMKTNKPKNTYNSDSADNKTETAQGQKQLTDHTQSFPASEVRTRMQQETGDSRNKDSEFPELKNC